MARAQASDSKAETALRLAIKELGAAIEGVVEHFNTLDPDDVPALLRSFKALKEQKDELDDWEKIISSLFSKLSQETIPAAFEKVGYDSIKLSGRNFVVGVRMFASIPQDKKEEGFKWLNEHGLGALIQPTVNPKSLSSALQSHFDEHATLPPTEAVTLYQQKYTSVRKV